MQHQFREFSAVIEPVDSRDKHRVRICPHLLSPYVTVDTSVVITMQRKSNGAVGKHCRIRFVRGHVRRRCKHVVLSIRAYIRIRRRQVVHVIHVDSIPEALSENGAHIRNFAFRSLRTEMVRIHQMDWGFPYTDKPAHENASSFRRDILRRRIALDISNNVGILDKDFSAVGRSDKPAQVAISLDFSFAIDLLESQFRI